MKILLDDYKRKLKTAEELIADNKNNGSIHDERRAERLITKAAEYRTIIVDIERAIAREQLIHKPVDYYVPEFKKNKK